jgi:glycosyltransferase involved in cell wall biosynthesis
LNESNPVVSVILPCYNAHRFLGQALDSVRAQTMNDLEILLIDDGSTDPDTISYLEALPGDVRIIRQENRGLSGARNRGFSEAHGLYVLPLDCDDWIDPKFLESTLQALQKAEVHGTAFAFCQLTLEGDAAGQLRKRFNFFEQLFANQLPYCMLMRKDTWNHVGGYDESLRLGYEDWEFNIRLVKSGAQAVCVDETLFHYRVSSTGMLLGTSRKRHSAIWGAIQRKHADLYEFAALIRLWRIWHRLPSAKPLWAYFALLACYRFLPEIAFLKIYNLALRFSESRELRSRST